MKSKLLVFVAVTVLSVLAAVAIAGIPSSSAAVDDVPTSTPSTEPTTIPPAATDTTTTEVLDESAVTEPPPTDPEPAVTTAGTDSVESGPIDSTDTDPSGSEPVASRPVDRNSVDVLVANGAAVAGLAGETADSLVDFGYLRVRFTDGSEILESSAVYATPGLEAEAERLAIDVGIDPSQVFPMSLSPELTELFETDLLVYLGVDAELL